MLNKTLLDLHFNKARREAASSFCLTTEEMSISPQKWPENFCHFCFFLFPQQPQLQNQTVALSSSGFAHTGSPLKIELA